MEKKYITLGEAIAKAAKVANKKTRKGEYVAKVEVWECSGINNKTTNALVCAYIYKPGGERQILIDVNVDGVTVRE